MSQKPAAIPHVKKNLQPLILALEELARNKLDPEMVVKLSKYLKRNSVYWNDEFQIFNSYRKFFVYSYKTSEYKDDSYIQSGKMLFGEILKDTFGNSSTVYLQAAYFYEYSVRGHKYSPPIVSIILKNRYHYSSNSKRKRGSNGIQQNSNYEHHGSIKAS